MPQISLSSGRQFEAERGESLLDAALRSGTTLPYSCRTGRCSTCRCKALTGETRPLSEELGLSAKERADGWILSCVRTAESATILEVEDLGGLRLPMPRTLACRINTIEYVATDVVRITLRLPPTAAFDFLPGQYIDVIGPQAVRRSYSIANSPAPDGLIELHVRRVAGGAMSSYWFDSAKTNDLLRLHGPLGTFFLRDVASRNLVLLATGTGIAPVKALMEGLASRPAKEQPASISVYWGGRCQDDFYWHPTAWPAGTRFVQVLSRDQSAWPGRMGYVQNAALADHGDLASVHVYACGSDAMIHSARSLLGDAGLPDIQFSSDAFVRSGVM